MKKRMVASDIRHRAYGCEKVFERYKAEKAHRSIVLKTVNLFAKILKDKHTTDFNFNNAELNFRQFPIV